MLVSKYSVYSFLSLKKCTDVFISPAFIINLLNGNLIWSLFSSVEIFSYFKNC